MFRCLYQKGDPCAVRTLLYLKTSCLTTNNYTQFIQQSVYIEIETEKVQSSNLEGKKNIKFQLELLKATINSFILRL
jgi:hypothetical protein